MKINFNFLDMKIKITLAILTMFLLGTVSVFANNKTEKFKVLGKCDMCKNRIESSAKELDGVSVATWDKNKQELTVTYDSKKATSQQIQTAITMKGHDTEMFKASNKRYAELPGCCKYPRSETQKVAGDENIGCENKNTSGSCCKND